MLHLTFLSHPSDLVNDRLDPARESGGTAGRAALPADVLRGVE
jgi:hypothetical protein